MTSNRADRSAESNCDPRVHWGLQSDRGECSGGRGRYSYGASRRSQWPSGRIGGSGGLHSTTDDFTILVDISEDDRELVAQRREAISASRDQGRLGTT
jgi:hypothetical protein